MPNRATEKISTRPFGMRAIRREIFWQQLKRRQFRSFKEVRAFQLTRVQELLKYADKYVPFYRDRFRKIGLLPEDVRTFEDYAQIPILTRQQIMEHLPTLWSRQFKEKDLFFLGTGGSTGTPMKHYQEPEYVDKSLEVLNRSHSWAGKGRWELMASFVSKREPQGLWGDAKRRLRAWSERKLYFNTYNASLEDFAEWIEVLKRYQPSFIYGYPSFLEVFAKWVQESKVKLPTVRGVFVSGEILYPVQRALLQRVFGAPIFNLYASQEVSGIAASCQEQRLHQVADWVLTEFIEDPELPSPRLVLTPLESFGMPLIRYANGDLGRPVTGTCPCGLVFPLMDLNVGRVVDVFVTPEGKRMWGQFFTHLMDGLGGVKQFQFHQLRANFIRLLIVKESNFDGASERKLSQVVNQIHKQASPQIEVEIQYIDEIKRTSTWKHIFTRSDVLSKPANVDSGVILA